MTKYVNTRMSATGLKLRKCREQAGYSLRKVAELIGLDTAILSKMERGERKLSKEIVLTLAKLYNADSNELIIEFLSEKVFYDLKDEEHGIKALRVAEKKISYNRKSLNPS